MTQLTDLQLALLTAAAQRPDGSILPPPDTLGAQMSRVRKAAVRLIALDLASEQPVTNEALSWRAADGTMFGVIINDAGRHHVAALSIGADVQVPSPAKRKTKSDTVVDLLARPDGASIEEIRAVTGWLAHTTRAVLTGLRNKGHKVEKRGERGSSRYHIVADA